MRKLLFLAAAAGLLAGAGCASDGYYGGAGYGYNSAAPADVWYDGYYGPYTDGYWRGGGVFYFRGQDGHFYRDRANHFRTSEFNGAQIYHTRHR